MPLLLPLTRDILAGGLQQPTELAMLLISDEQLAWLIRPRLEGFTDELARQMGEQEGPAGDAARRVLQVVNEPPQDIRPLTCAY